MCVCVCLCVCDKQYIFFNHPSITSPFLVTPLTVATAMFCQRSTLSLFFASTELSQHWELKRNPSPNYENPDWQWALPAIFDVTVLGFTLIILYYITHGSSFLSLFNGVVFIDPINTNETTILQPCTRLRVNWGLWVQLLCQTKVRSFFRLVDRIFNPEQSWAPPHPVTPHPYILSDSFTYGLLHFLLCGRVLVRSNLNSIFHFISSYTLKHHLCSL